ncbi:MAG: rhomboid family intramembrane serine protease [Crocinitomicaceae bacterium]|nr:rhomboid family intramembrane serine protease [Flavobacteriales bacterium]NQZ36944.1 rhomboid family intramembrane serine protease [Crocinitomicaceae bacterium]
MRVTVNAPFSIIFSIAAIALYFLFQADGTIPRMLTLHGDFQFSNWEWYISLVGYTLGHASIAHLIGNISILLLIGPFIEKRWGTKRLAIMFVMAAVITALVHIIFWDHRLIGASGIVFMMIVLSSLVDLKSKEIPLTFILIVFLFIGQELVRSFGDDQVSQFAHICGGVLGGIFGFSYRSAGRY